MRRGALDAEEQPVGRGRGHWWRAWRAPRGCGAKLNISNLLGGDGGRWVGAVEESRMRNDKAEF